LAENLFTGMAVTGRSNTYISAHVPGELVRHLADVPEGHPGLDLWEAERVGSPREVWRPLCLRTAC
jgi:hypothetical protein